MNFLAHLWLADRTRTSLAGAVLGDVVRGSDLGAYPDAIAMGIRLHRRVDALTDRHPALLPLREAFPAGTRRYAGVVLDLVSDYLLAQDWAAHSTEPLPAFCARAGEAIAEASTWFELGGGRAPAASGFTDLLLSYATQPGIDRALTRTANRLRRPALLLDAAADWQRHIEPLRGALSPLLADLGDEVRRATLGLERA